MLPIRSERNVSAAAVAAMVCRKVLTFDPSETMPPSTAAIVPRTTTALDPSRPSTAPSSNAAQPDITIFEAMMIFRHRSATSASCSIRASMREIDRSGRPHPSDQLFSTVLLWANSVPAHQRTAIGWTIQEMVCGREASTLMKLAII